MAMIHLGDHSDQAQAPAGAAKGLVQRNLATHPKGCYATIPVAGLQPMSDEDIIAAIARKNADRSWLSDLREIGNNGQRIPSRDQNGRGYCWQHSGVSAMLLCRARDHSPYADLSAYGPSCIIKNFADQGGWGAEGAAFLSGELASKFGGRMGCPTSKTWPQQGVSRSYDKPETWEEAKLYAITLRFTDIPDSDHRLAATYIIHDVPVIFDINAWSHSVCGCKVTSWGTSRSQRKFQQWNSWGESWSENGMGEISGSYLPNDMVAVDSVRVG
jgi:hypothetical protein